LINETIQLAAINTPSMINKTNTRHKIPSHFTKSAHEKHSFSKKQMMWTSAGFKPADTSTTNMTA